MTTSAGLRPYKIDLHVHTLASKCYVSKKDTAEEIVAAALSQKLAAIAVTDHNSGAWIDRMQEASAGKLVIFPGVEISVVSLS